MIVEAEVVQAATLATVDRFRIECQPAELGVELGREVDALARRLWIDEKVAPPAHVAESFEVDWLKELVLADLSRFRRRSPTDFGERRLVFPGHPEPAATEVKSDSALGRHLLAKSIDRLESILFISPDDAEAACALGFCYTMHPEKIYRPDRADELLRKAYAFDPESQVAAIALGFLAEVDYDDHSGELAPDRDAGAAIERIWFAFEHMPEKYRDWHWPRLLGVIGDLGRDPSRAMLLADMMTRAPLTPRMPTSGTARCWPRRSWGWPSS